MTRIIKPFANSNKASLTPYTDYPHIDSRWPHAVEIFLSQPGISEESTRKILWDNCARLYNLA